MISTHLGPILSPVQALPGALECVGVILSVTQPACTGCVEMEETKDRSRGLHRSPATGQEREYCGPQPPSDVTLSPPPCVLL